MAVPVDDEDTPDIRVLAHGLACGDDQPVEGAVAPGKVVARMVESLRGRAGDAPRTGKLRTEDMIGRGPEGCARVPEGVVDALVPGAEAVGQAHREHALDEPGVMGDGEVVIGEWGERAVWHTA